MKTPTPLAAALLLIAASAAAQPYAAGVGPSFSMTGTNPAPFSYAPGSAMIDEMVFKCGTVPYVACTAAQLNLREAVKASRTCPQPAIPACVDYLMKMKDTGTAPFQLLGNQANPSTANDEFFKKCGTVPYRLCTPDEEAQKATWEKEQAKRAAESGLPYDQQPGFIGPPAPPAAGHGPINASNSAGMFSDPPAFSPAEFQKELSDARSDNPYPVIDLGDNRYGVVTPDGEVQVCGKGVCAGTRDPSRIPNFQDKIQQARAEAVAFTGASGGGQTNKTVPSTPGINNAGQTGSVNQADDTSPSDEAKGMGRQAAADSVAVSGTSGSSGSGSSVASSGSPSSGGATAEQVIKTKAAALGSIEITYTRLQQTEDSIKGAAGAFNNGQMTGFASPNAPAASGRLAEPPVDEKYLGKIQASSNE